MTIALEKSESVWLMMLIFEHLSSGVSLPNIYQLRVRVVNDMVDVTNVLPAALKYSLLVIHAFYMAHTPLLDYIFTSVLQLRALSNKIPSKAIADVFYNKDSSMDDIFTAGDNLMKSLYNCTKVEIFGVPTDKSLGLVTRQKRKRR